MTKWEEHGMRAKIHQVFNWKLKKLNNKMGGTGNESKDTPNNELEAKKAK